MLREADAEEISKRMDLQIMQAFQENEDVLHTRNQIIANWRDNDQLKSLSPSLVSKLEGITVDEEDGAVRNLVDYWLEHLALPTMSFGQARDYFLAIEDSIEINWVEPLKIQPNRPLILESMHHHCIFSMLMRVLFQLAQDHDFNKFIMLHLNAPLDARLEVCRRLFDDQENYTGICMQLEGDWLKKLNEEITDRTVIIYLGDMAPKFFGRSNKEGNSSSILHIQTERAGEFRTIGVTISSLLKKKYQASHLILDYPAKNQARIRSCGDRVELSCPLDQWIFWPAIGRWYEKSSDPTTAGKS